VVQTKKADLSLGQHEPRSKIDEPARTNNLKHEPSVARAGSSVNRLNHHKPTQKTLKIKNFH
jgi:hypothetical protein